MMMQAFRRLRGAGEGGLEADLRQMSETSYMESPPKELLARVMQASEYAEDRKRIVLHMQACLADTRWRAILSGLSLLSELLQRGCPRLFEEMAQGFHFDPLQRLSLLERFEYGDDPRVQKLVRQKASTLREALLEKLASSSDMTPVEDLKGFSNADVLVKPLQRRPGPVNGVAVIGHSEDTDDEASEGELSSPGLHHAGSTVSTESSGELLVLEGDAVTKAGPGNSSPTVDLLDLA
ncbi:Actr1a [Symbiodinium natans]|uniref:Actr1a protein n=1 Tax=Symbiodinium natans TaxID=878477 RepID=A0A812GDB6_9DINO|nr:Actr1a [Symbiodinium natans]